MYWFTNYSIRVKQPDLGNNICIYATRCLFVCLPSFVNISFCKSRLSIYYFTSLFLNIYLSGAFSVRIFANLNICLSFSQPLPLSLFQPIGWPLLCLISLLTRSLSIRLPNPPTVYLFAIPPSFCLFASPSSVYLCASPTSALSNICRLPSFCLFWPTVY